MMPVKRSTIAGIALGLLLPLSSAAYLPPEDVLTDEFLPPYSREAKARVEAQDQRSADRRAAQQAAAEAEAHAAAPQASSASSEASSAESSAAYKGSGDPRIDRAVEMLSEREARLIERVQDNQLESELAQLRAPGNDTLHSGAPLLHDTGMGTVAAMISIALAIVWTMWRARRGSAQSL